MTGYLSLAHEADCTLIDKTSREEVFLTEMEGHQAMRKAARLPILDLPK